MTVRTLKFSGRIKESVQEIMPEISSAWRANSCVITDVAMTKDLSIAKVFVMNMQGDSAEVLKILNACSRQIAHRVGQVNQFRRVPQIRFLADESYAESKKLAELSRILAEDAEVAG